MPDEIHRAADSLHPLLGYLGGVLAVFAAAFGFWWRDKVSTRALIDKNMTTVYCELAEIRKEMKADAKEMRAGIAANSKTNGSAHADILKTMNDQHTKIINKMMALHTK